MEFPRKHCNPVKAQLTWHIHLIPGIFKDLLRLLLTVTFSDLHLLPLKLYRHTWNKNSIKTPTLLKKIGSTFKEEKTQES